MIIAERYLFTPWERELVEYTKRIERSLYLVCPFIKLPIIKKLLLAIPEENSIAIRILTRFTKQVFSQGSSDLSVFDIMLNYAAKKHNVSIYNLENVHAKIYVFDQEEMFLTSSNLSYAGLNTNFEIAVRINDENEIKEVCSYIQSSFSEAKLISSEDIVQMSQMLKTRTRRLVELGQIGELEAQPIDTPVPDIEDSILSEYEEPLEDDTDLIQVEKKMQTLEEINNFLKERGVSEYNQIEGKVFESTKRPMTRGIDVSREELERFTGYWNEQASRDEKMLEEYLQKLFGEILSNDKEKIGYLKMSFMHISWENVYRPELLQDYRPRFFRELGNELHKWLVLKELTEKRLFAEEELHRYETRRQYIMRNYPYASILSDIGCRLVLHMGELSEGIDRDIFDSLIGYLAVLLPWNTFLTLYENVFCKIDDFIYDDYRTFDYKSCFQDMVQKDYGLPEYSVIGESGLDHEKVYEVAVSLRKKEFGRGFGRSKKEAEVAAAYQGIVNASERLHLEIPPRKRKWPHLAKYSISIDRIAQITKLSQRLPVIINNIRLLDVALTHSSYVNEHREKRSNLRLALYGAHLEQFLRRLCYHNRLNGVITEKHISALQVLSRLSPSTRFADWFDKTELQNFLNRGKGLCEIPIAAKVETVQAIIAVIFIEKGILHTTDFVQMLWEDVLETDIAEAESSYVAKLQEIVQGLLRVDSSQAIVYEVFRETKLPPGNRMEYEICCVIEGIEYGRGLGGTKRAARNEAAAKALKNEEFVRKYIKIHE